MNLTVIAQNNRCKCHDRWWYLGGVVISANRDSLPIQNSRLTVPRRTLDPRGDEETVIIIQTRVLSAENKLAAILVDLDLACKYSFGVHILRVVENAPQSNLGVIDFSDARVGGGVKQKAGRDATVSPECGVEGSPEQRGDVGVEGGVRKDRRLRGRHGRNGRVIELDEAIHVEVEAGERAPIKRKVEANVEQVGGAGSQLKGDAARLIDYIKS